MTVRTEDFERHRSLLFSIAYRMLGSVAEAEDVVQEAYLRWREVAEARRLTVPDLRCPEGGEVPRRGASHGAAWFLRQSCADQWRTGRGRLRRRPLHGVVALDVAEDRIRGVRIVVNPDKLRAIPPSSPDL